MAKSTSSNPVPSVAEPHALKRERRAIGRLRQCVDHYDTRSVEIAQYVTNLIDVADAMVTDLVEIASGCLALYIKGLPEMLRRTGSVTRLVVQAGVQTSVVAADR
ncbi:TPA: hypothetical protein ACUNF5_006526 [Burkholderia orbicola]|uniref:hypothetical protein n=1 Tax=Burkholderia orbicola TaxID=2978683 RepID=UPI00264CCEAF|nr:hypothetical protein [Burkholderia orbicola]MDN7533939.1 hypothetical protein [Burkholderia orbicola]